MSTLYDPMDCSLSGSSVHGISEARIMEWVAIPFSRDLLAPGIKPAFPALQVDSLPPSHGKALVIFYCKHVFNSCFLDGEVGRESIGSG